MWQSPGPCFWAPPMNYGKCWGFTVSKTRHAERAFDADSLLTHSLGDSVAGATTAETSHRGDGMEPDRLAQDLIALRLKAFNLIKERSFERRGVVLSSGKKSDYYL